MTSLGNSVFCGTLNCDTINATNAAVPHKVVGNFEITGDLALDGYNQLNNTIIFEDEFTTGGAVDFGQGAVLDAPNKSVIVLDCRNTQNVTSLSAIINAGVNLNQLAVGWKVTVSAQQYNILTDACGIDYYTVYPDMNNNNLFSVSIFFKSTDGSNHWNSGIDQRFFIELTKTNI